MPNTPANPLQVPPWARSAYTEALLYARDSGYLIAGATLEQVQAAFRRAVRDLTAILDADPNPLQEARARELIVAMGRALDALAQRVVTATANGRDATLRDLAAVHRGANEEILRRTGGNGARQARATTSFTELPFRAVQALVARQGLAGGSSGDFRSLVTRNIQRSGRALDEIVAAAVARGESSRSLAPKVQAVLVQGMDARGDWRAELASGLVAEDTLRELAATGYDARRIARSEIMNALREGNAQGMLLSPVLVGSRWQLSGRHFDWDECDVIALMDAHQLGPGGYPAEWWPTAPHPHCACYAGAPIFRDPREWDTPKTPAPPRALDPLTLDPTTLPGAPKRQDARGDGGWTPARIRRAQQTVRAALPDRPRGTPALIPA